MLGDCLERMKEIESLSVDLVLTDPPYGTTACKWDSVIPLEPMWEQVLRIAKNNAAIVLFSSQPFTSSLVCSKIDLFRYEWIWDKVTISNPMLAKKQPLKQHEVIVVFSKRTHIYIPQKTDLHLIRKWKQSKQNEDATCPAIIGSTGIVRGKYPKSIQTFLPAKFSGNIKHPTQKPVELMEYLIKTYTNEGDTVLDFAMGSGTTGVACKNLNRQFIGIELDPKYFAIAKQRMGISGVKVRVKRHV